ncbi:unnamed protein product, partial [Staurois parvus]
ESLCPCSVYCVWLESVFFSFERVHIVNAGSGETGYSECRVRGDRI